MKAFCTNCLTNWASLHSQTEGDESYDYCPLCNTDSFLEEPKEGDAYMMCAITGKVINVTTGEQLRESVKPSQPTPPPFDWDNWKKQKAEQERQEEADIVQYQELYERGDKEQAEQHFYELRRKHV